MACARPQRSPRPSRSTCDCDEIGRVQHVDLLEPVRPSNAGVHHVHDCHQRTRWPRCLPDAEFDDDQLSKPAILQAEITSGSAAGPRCRCPAWQRSHEDALVVDCVHRYAIASSAPPPRRRTDRSIGRRSSGDPADRAQAQHELVGERTLAGPPVPVDPRAGTVSPAAASRSGIRVISS